MMNSTTCKNRWWKGRTESNARLKLGNSAPCVLVARRPIGSSPTRPGANMGPRTGSNVGNLPSRGHPLSSEIPSSPLCPSSYTFKTQNDHFLELGLNSCLLRSRQCSLLLPTFSLRDLQKENATANRKKVWLTSNSNLFLPRNQSASSAFSLRIRSLWTSLSSFLY